MCIKTNNAENILRQDDLIITDFSTDFTTEITIVTRVILISLHIHSV